MSTLPLLEVRDLALESVREEKGSDERTADMLYRRCDLKALPGELVLLLGPSGSGKTLLTNLLLNLASPVSRTLIINEGDERRRPSMLFRASQGAGRPPREVEVLADLYPEEVRGRVGVMFQSLGLLEDLTAEENLSFANDQSAQPRRGLEWTTWVKETLARLNLSEQLLHEPVGKLSGGQRQRVALGRMLAYSPEVMVFDEPTAALDPLSARGAVQLIREAHDAQHKRLQAQGGGALTLIITHDYYTFLPVADRVWFLSQEREFLDERPPSSAEDYERRLAQARLPAARPLPLPERLKHEARVDDRHAAVALERASSSVSRGLAALKSAWLGRYLKTFATRVIWEGLPFHLAAGFGLGAVATYFSFNMELGSVGVEGVGDVQVSHFVLPTFFEQMLSGFGVVLYRALIPLFTCICVAARSGTAVTAYLSEMRDEGRRQWDALENLGVPPGWFFVPQLALVFSAGCVLLSYASFWLASLGSLLVAMLTNPLCTFYTWRDTYWASLHASGGVWFEGSGLFIVKTALAGLCIALISSYYGTRERKTTLDMMANLSRANVWSVLVTLGVFFMLLVYEARP